MDEVTLRRWSAEDIELLRAANTPEMTAHLNGPESETEIVERNERYLRLGESGEAKTFVILDGDRRPLGSIAYWDVEWHDAPALETGWFVLPHAQGRGVASTALALLVEDARTHRRARNILTAYPAVGNIGSNGVCRRGGFRLVGVKTEVFRGADLIMNEWMLDLRGGIGVANGA